MGLTGKMTTCGPIRVPFVGLEGGLDILLLSRAMSLLHASTVDDLNIFCRASSLLFFLISCESVLYILRRT